MPLSECVSAAANHGGGGVVGKVPCAGEHAGELAVEHGAEDDEQERDLGDDVS